MFASISWLTAMLALLAFVAPPAAAQTVTLEPSAATRCMTPAADQRGVPEYPFDAWKRNEKGYVLVELSFTTPDKRPAVKVLQSDGGSAFVAAVREHVTSYRVPCVDGAAATPAELRFEFVFRPDDRQVYASEAVDAMDGRRAKLLECVTHSSGKKAPEYPHLALRAELQGRVLARLRFFSADQAPQAQVFSRAAAATLANAVEAMAQGYRMPCFEGTEAIDSFWEFVFLIEGSSAFGFKPLTLPTLLGRVRGIQAQTLQLDTTTMACPFEVRFQYRQPYIANGVGEMGSREPARRPLLAWLAAQHLDLPPRSLDAVFGDSTVITVPCTKIDLKPKETP